MRLPTAAESVALAKGGQARQKTHSRIKSSGPGQDTSPLTAREHEVSSLIADSLTNRQIAEALVISRRTAETHVQQILAKLGFETRTRVAQWFVHTGRPAV